MAPVPHQFVAVMKARGETWQLVAADVGVSRETLRTVGYNRALVWPRLRQALVVHFGLPESELWVTVV